MKIAVTGASGFIGRHVLDELLNQNVQITAVTRDAKRISPPNKRVSLVEMDLSQPPQDAFIQMGSPDVLIHLAWNGLPNYKSLHHLESELPKQFYFLKTMVESGLKSMLVTGTCFEYGMQSGALAEHLETKPDNPYGFAKDTLRKQLEFLRRVKPFHLTWARLFYMHGEGQPATSLLPLLKTAVERGDPVFNMSGGEQLRDYLPVTEVAQRIVRLAMLNQHIGPVNVCSGTPISVRRLVEQWLREYHWKIELNLGHYPYPDYEPMAFWGDGKYLNEVLGTRSK
ncbi:MAG: NAD(P)-dependent oxidoreductase [Deltaproteobacteria bacterium]|nr:NAD(P)-dependent oxidoreductase [Deltaproteobacteria bacterium]